MKTIIKGTTSSSVDAYITQSPKEAKELLQTLRTIIKEEAPDATEVLSYGMPAYKLHGMLVYFAAHAHHVGLYPMPSALIKFEKELTSYVTSKSTIQFPFDKPLPVTLIRKILKFRVKENLAKMKEKKNK
jgi:uncharacterized protein YdhG (YjbR/CyaY superfamily)